MLSGTRQLLYNLGSPRWVCGKRKDVTTIDNVYLYTPLELCKSLSPASQSAVAHAAAVISIIAARCPPCTERRIVDVVVVS